MWIAVHFTVADSSKVIIENVVVSNVRLHMLKITVKTEVVHVFVICKCRVVYATCGVSSVGFDTSHTTHSGINVFCGF